MNARVPTRSFELTIRLRYERPDDSEPVAPCWWLGADATVPTEAECVRQHVAQAIPGVLPDADGDEAATLMSFGIESTAIERYEAEGDRG